MKHVLKEEEEGEEEEEEEAEEGILYICSGLSLPSSLVLRCL
jgi:hypothetical protein